MAATVTLKIKFQDTVHRVLLQSHPVSYEAVAEAIQEIYPGEVIATYLNEEGDLGVLSAATFSSFLGPSGSEGGDAVLRLELFPVVPGTANVKLVEWAGPTTAQGLHTPEGTDKGKGEGKGTFKGKGKCKGKGKSKGESKFSFKGEGKGEGKGKSKGKGGPHAAADGNDSVDDLRERQVATGFEDMFRSLSLQCSQWSRWASRALKSSTGKGKCKGKGKGKGRRNGAAQPGTDALSPIAAPNASAAAAVGAQQPK